MGYVIKKCFIIFLVVNFCIFIFDVSKVQTATSYKKYAWPLLGVSLLAGYGSTYLRKNAIQKYDDAEILYQEYLAIPSTEKNNEVYEKKFELYEDKYGEAKQMRTYYILCMSGAVLAFAGSIFLFFYNPSSKMINVGYNIDYNHGYNDLHLKIKF